MRLHIRRPMIPIFLTVFLGTVIFRPLLLQGYDRERQPFLTLYENKEKDCIVVGRVTNIYEGEDKKILILTDCTISGYEEDVARKCGGVRLYVDSEGDFRCGCKVRAYGGIKVFMEADNPGQFDAYSYYRREHLYANVYAEKVFTLGEQSDTLRQGLVSLRLLFEDSYKRLYPSEEAGVIYALVTGDKSLLGTEVKDSFKMAGLSHILAVSGLHISLSCLGINKILKFFTVRKRLRDAITMVFTLIFVLFTGAGISVVRAGIMCICLLLAENMEMRYDLLSALCFAGTVELLIYPLEALSPSFLLSYTAILGVYAAGRMRVGALGGLVINLFTLPVTLYFYYEISPYAVLAGMLVIPVTGIILGFALLSGIIGMFSTTIGLLPASIAYAGVNWMKMVSHLVQKLPFSTITPGQPEIAGIAVYYFLLFLATRAMVKYREEVDGITIEGRKRSLLIRQAGVRLAFVEIAVSIACIPALGLHSPHKGVTFLSVGQGDGIVYHDRETILFDGGSSSESSIGKYILSPFIKRMGVNIIDMAVVSHMDKDHISGVLELLEAMPVYRGKWAFVASYKGNIAIQRLALPKVKEWSEDYIKLVELAKSKGVEVFFLEQGDRVSLDRAEMLCMWPREARESDNETSLVMLLADKNKAYLMTGDATTEAEEAIIDLYPEGLKHQVMAMGYSPGQYILKVGHHGSKTSTCEAFLHWGHFDSAVISVGHFNTYGHPRQEVLDRLADFDIHVHRTDMEWAVMK